LIRTLCYGSINYQQEPSANKAKADTRRKSIVHKKASTGGAITGGTTSFLFLCANARSTALALKLSENILSKRKRENPVQIISL